MTPDIERSLPATWGSTDVRLTFRWRRSDPYAVSIHFEHRGDTPVHLLWRIDRDTLANGVMYGQSWDLTCRVETLGGITASHTRLLLYRPAFGAFTVHPSDLLALVDATCDLVPRGEEHRQFDLDAELAQLVRETRG